MDAGKVLCSLYRVTEDEGLVPCSSASLVVGKTERSMEKMNTTGTET